MAEKRVHIEYVIAQVAQLADRICVHNDLVQPGTELGCIRALVRSGNEQTSKSDQVGRITQQRIRKVRIIQQMQGILRRFFIQFRILRIFTQRSVWVEDDQVAMKRIQHVKFTRLNIRVCVCMRKLGSCNTQVRTCP